MFLSMDVSRESGAPADQVEETPGRASLEKMGCRTPPQLHAGGVGRRQQEKINDECIMKLWMKSTLRTSYRRYPFYL